VDVRPTVTSTSNAAVKAARRLARTNRRSGEPFLVEGPQAVREAVAHLRRLFVTEAAAGRHPDLVERAERSGADIIVVSEPVLESLADTVAPQGLIGVADLASADLDVVAGASSLIVVLWEVRDPGNAGTIIRTADAAGADAVVLAGDSVDPRNAKAVRASAGSLFHLPVAQVGEWQEVAAACRSAGLRLLAADARGTVRHTELDLTAGSALVFGNEARGLDAKVVDDCDLVARVPIHGAAESLNLAATAAVMLYEAARQRAVEVPA
jgi:RNA methyltransferase, TrmH family